MRSPARHLRDVWRLLTRRAALEQELDVEVRGFADELIARRIAMPRGFAGFPTRTWVASILFDADDVRPALSGVVALASPYLPARAPVGVR